jgi:hypothetical protein
MGFLAFCLLFGCVAVTIWGAIKSKDERAKLVAEFNEAPMKAIFVIVWVSAAFMFFFGIFVPVLGEKESWSRNFGPVVKLDRMMREVIQNEETKEPFA